MERQKTDSLYEQRNVWPRSLIKDINEAKADYSDQFDK